MSKLKKGVVFIVIPLLLAIGVCVLLNSVLMKDQTSPVAAKNYSDVVNLIKQDKIESFSLNVTTGHMVYVLRSEPKQEHYFTIANAAFFHEDIKEYVSEKITMNYKSGSIWATLRTVLPTLIMLVGGFFIIKMLTRSMPGQDRTGTSNKSIPKIHSEKKFSDVAGADEEKLELEEVVDFLKNSNKFVNMGAHIPRGILLVGPPGTGKTLLAKAVAGEAQVPFFSLCGSDFMEMYVGVGASRVRSLFEKAKRQAPSIIFIDEIDAIGGKRGGAAAGGNDERERTLNQLLVEMDGFSGNQGVIVLAATNRPDMLDKALLRPGRFDRQIVVNIPDVVGREEILKIHASDKKLDKSIDLHGIAQNTVGFSGADLENLLNEAALLAVRNGHAAIIKEDIENAMLKVVVGTEKKHSVMTKQDKEITAYHEAGHALVSYYLPGSNPVQQISIIPRGMAGGFTMYQQTNDKMYFSKDELYNRICELLGGRAAETLSQNSITSGASNDMDRATDLAKQMVIRFGMSPDIGLRTYQVDSNGNYIGISEKAGERIDQEIKQILDNQFARALKLLRENSDKLKSVATTLLQKEKISGDEFRALLQ